MTLRDYQIDLSRKAAEILREKGICLLAMECRTGKTITAFQTAINVGASSVLFVTPKKAIPSIWNDYGMAKMDNMFIFELNVINPEQLLAKHKEAERAATKIIENKYPTLSVKGTRFKTLVSDEIDNQLSLLMPYISKNAVDMVIVDECHRQGAFPKPSGSQQVIRKLSKGKKVLLLSGTPSPESYSQLFHEFQICDRSPWAEYRNFYAWAKAGYVNSCTKMVNGLQVADYSNATSRVMSDARPYTLTFTQQEAGFETKVEIKNLYVEMNETTYKFYKDLKKNRVATYWDMEIACETPADLLNKLHQISGGTIKGENETRIIDYSKANYLKTFCDGKHVAIFYVYKAENDLLKFVFGDRVTEDWQEFQKSKEPRVFIGQIRSVREGIRLDSADFSVFYSTEYSYVSWAQGIMRIASKERTEPAIVYTMTSQCRIEQLILDAVNKKEDFTLSYYYHND